MPLSRLVDCVGFDTATTGTGSVTVGSVLTDAINGDYLLPGDVGISSAIPCSYRIVQGDAKNNFEIGRGTISSTTLTRDSVTRSKIAGTAGTTKLTLGGTSKVYIVTLGADLDDTIIRALSADTALSNATGAQALFGGLTAITLLGLTAYELEMILWITRSAGTTSHTVALSFTGTATLTSIDFLASVSNPSGNNNAAASEVIIQNAGSNTITAANTSATEHLRIALSGIVRVNAGGTFIPNLAYSAAPGGVPSVVRNSRIRFKPFGTNTDTARN